MLQLPWSGQAWCRFCCSRPWRSFCYPRLIRPQALRTRSRRTIVRARRTNMKPAVSLSKIERRKDGKALREKCPRALQAEVGAGIEVTGPPVVQAHNHTKVAALPARWNIKVTLRILLAWNF